ncbi:protein of unknown function [Ruaniaceae bacterium KH17]|nr:protein of unknown function [Ruaniaceae bacterium KH17]
MSASRAIWGVLALLLLVAVVAACVTWGWRATVIAVVFGMLPDATLIGAFAERGRLKSSRVRGYNFAHSPSLACAIIGVGAIGWLATSATSGGYWPALLAGLAWLMHIAVDRLVGYGLRAPDGSIIPVGARP